MTRYEAVAVLRCGSYADIVEEAVRSLVAEEGAHTAAVNALSAAAERPTPRLLAWTASLLTHESPVLARAAATAIENMRAVGGLDDDEWEVVVPHFLAGFETADQRPGHAETFTTLFKNLPASLRLTILDRLPRPLTPVAGPLSWNADTHNVHYALCDRLSREVTAEVEVSDQPMVARMLFEIIYDFRAPRITTSAFLLMASPLVDALQPRLACLSVDGPDEVTRAGALRGLHHLQVPRGREALQQWFDTARPLTCGRALVVAGNAGLEVPDEVVDLVRDDSELSRSALECLGLTQHPGLALLADDPARPEVVRTIARWWLRTGGRVTV